MKKACAHCRRPFEALSDRAAYCGGACRAAASRKRQAASATAPLGRAALLLDEVRAAVQEAREALTTREQKGRRR